MSQALWTFATRGVRLASLPLDTLDILGSALPLQIATADSEQRIQLNGKKRVAAVLLDEPKSSRSIVCVGAEDAPTAHVPHRWNY